MSDMRIQTVDQKMIINLVFRKYIAFNKTLTFFFLRVGFLSFFYLRFFVEKLQALHKEGSMPASLDIFHFNMHLRSLNDALVPAVACLLKGMPNLNTLNIKSKPPRGQPCMVSEILYSLLTILFHLYFLV